MFSNTDASLVRVHMDEPLATERLAMSLAGLPIRRDTVVVCVGTDRSTGDCLGPLVGSGLTECIGEVLPVYGTLDEPVHALNLEDISKRVAADHHSSTVVAIDACLGKTKNVGSISLKKGPLRPGTGVNKKLPHIGDYHVIGVVNIGGFMEHLVLQNTRLSLVTKMAKIITEAIVMASNSWFSMDPELVRESAPTASSPPF